LFEPWKAPLQIQKESDCIIGKDYPGPIIDFEKASRENDLKIKQYFQTDNLEAFRSFLENKEVIRPSNQKEYNFFTYDSFLESDLSKEG
jgi:hypothetical protein